MPFAHPFVSVIKQCIMRCDVMRRGIYRQMSLHMIFWSVLFPSRSMRMAAVRMYMCTFTPQLVLSHVGGKHRKVNVSTLVSSWVGLFQIVCSLMLLGIEC